VRFKDSKNIFALRNNQAFVVFFSFSEEEEC
jgi:hypothetical protein